MIFGLIILLLLAPVLVVVVKVIVVVKVLGSSSDSFATAVSQQGRAVVPQPRRVAQTVRTPSTVTKGSPNVSGAESSPPSVGKNVPALPNPFLTATAGEVRAFFPRRQRSASELTFSLGATVAFVVMSLAMWSTFGGLAKLVMLVGTSVVAWLSLRMFLLESEITVSPGILVHRRMFFREVITTYTHFNVQGLTVDAGSMIVGEPRFRIMLRTSEGRSHALAELIPSRILAEQTAAALTQYFGLEQYEDQFPTPIRRSVSQSMVLETEPRRPDRQPGEPWRVRDSSGRPPSGMTSGDP